MEIVKVLHMNKGDGETSYAKNSTLQNKIISTAKPLIQEAVTKMVSNHKTATSIDIADLGCSSGPNTFSLVSQILEIIHENSENPKLEFRIFLNDLPANDFNSVFGLLPEFYANLNEKRKENHRSCFINATPGSFYGRLFPSESIHCVHSSSSLHWISRVPPGLNNKGKIYISKSSPDSVVKSYSKQFRKDFSGFLKCRSEEVIEGGCMVLSFIGRKTSDPTTEESCYQWELLANALMSLVNEGRIEEEKVDTFDAPYYAPCAEEIETEVEKEGSFVIDSLQDFEIQWDGDNNESLAVNRGKKVAKTIRAVVEEMLRSHFGGEIMDDLFHRYSELVDDYLSDHETCYTNFVVSMFRKSY